MSVYRLMSRGTALQGYICTKRRHWSACASCSLIRVFAMHSVGRHGSKASLGGYQWLWSACAKTKIITKPHPFSIMALFMAVKVKKSFRWRKCDHFVIFARNRDCGYSLEPPHSGGSNGYPQSMFYNRNKRNNVYPCKPHFFYIKVGFEGIKIT